MENVKIVAVGDGAVGKTCLMFTYVNNTFPLDYVPTVFDNYSANLIIEKGGVVNLSLWDTAGQDDYERLRPLSYPQTDVFVLCFAIDSKASLNNAKNKWYPELRNHGPPGTPIYLVGTKGDLRHQDGHTLVSEEEALAMATDIGASAYHEVSAMTMDGVHELFKSAATFGVQRRRQKSKHIRRHKRCTVM